LSAVEFDADLRPRPPGASSPHRVPLTARAVELAAGPFDPLRLVGDPNGWLGLLVLDGLILVEVEAGHAPAGWLVGTEDIVRPWDANAVSLIADATWRVVSQARVALLDGAFARRSATTPEVVPTLVSRAAQTTHWLLAKSLITATPVVEERLLLLFALLGERWGKATRDGISIGLPLTHRVLASLVGARRPSVSTALGSLTVEGLVRREKNGAWILSRSGTYPDACEPRCWQRYVRALGLDEPTVDAAVSPRTVAVTQGPVLGTVDL
jgi:hypothetical protein